MQPENSIEVSIVIPCLNEALTIRNCIAAAKSYFSTSGVSGEVVVADNGSSDGSQGLAEAAGARVVKVSERGYGAALRKGFMSARGRLLVMGDGDESYDFSRLGAFIEKLRDGFDVVIGNRFKGGIAKGAMPLLHRYLGNPILSLLGRVFFKTKIGDFHCGLRALTKDAFSRLQLTTTGMEFASEMIVKASLAGMRIAEVPTTLSRDGRNRPPHLRTWRDGWRHLRFLLTYSPRWLFLYPGLILFAIGTLGQALLFRGGIRLGSLGLDIHTMLYAAATTIIGVQMVWFAIFTKVYGAAAGLLPHDTRLERVLNVLTLERGVVIGLALLALGIGLSANAAFDWAKLDYGVLEPREVMRIAIPSVSMILAGMEFILASFFLGILRIEHRQDVQ